MKIREKLIHLLGGHTDREYQMNNNTKVRIPVIYNEKPIKTVRASYWFQTDEDMTDEQKIGFVKEGLAKKLAERMMLGGLIVYTSMEPRELTATVKAVDMAFMEGGDADRIGDTRVYSRQRAEVQE